MKKLINAPDDLVGESLEGMALAHADLLRVNTAPPFVARAQAKGRGKVALVSGGGSGHEPMHGGFVGRGMLDAACPGAVFTSPTPDQIAEATRAVDGGAGVLHIIKNYTGDVMNFEMAAELAREAGIAVEGVVVNDDVAVEDSLYTAGRRGVGTTVLAEKICGGAAEAGRPLDEVAALCRRVNAAGRSMGIALSACAVPHVGKPSFELGPDEMEVGIGIHGEPGRRRERLEPADRVAELLMQPILDDLPFKPGDDVLLFVNGMGGTPLIELYVVYRKAHAIARERGLNVARSLVGPYITSLEMAGVSVTLLRLDGEMIRWWDAPVHTPALRWGA
ncbi:dihydroxyacetone kinase subunit DhaK [Sorangium sp. So ce131]|uniref:dihydroxyacetone kinase subunit DhaK n=1 Tax=Sorangium sp. So ce131 TaxID=3133282 RepID=UPI003F5E7626